LGEDKGERIKVKGEKIEDKKLRRWEGGTLMRQLIDMDQVTYGMDSIFIKANGTPRLNKCKRDFIGQADKDGLTRINKNTIWLAFGDNELIAGLPPLYIKTFLRRRRFKNSV
jgi:hypothetical protein